MRKRLGALAFLALVAGCGGGGGGGSTPPAPQPSVGATFAPSPAPTSTAKATPTPTPSPLATAAPASIKHIVIIFQENRSVDNLFNGLPGADTVASGLNSAGATVALQPVSLTAPYDLDHSHKAFVTEINGGAMNGFDKENSSSCTSGCLPENQRAYGIVPTSETAQYRALATQYTFGDRMFQTNEGPSFPAHQYIISGTSALGATGTVSYADNPEKPGGGTTAGCDAPAGTTVGTIDLVTGATGTSTPCTDHPTLMDLLDAHQITWRYYQSSDYAGLWNAPDAISHLRYGADFANVSTPSSNVLSDIAAGNLANVSWVIPNAGESDHAVSTNGSGPAWVASIVNAIGASPYWNSTAIFVTWDDWGGWYDHVKPQQYNQYELGFRVPLLVVSPYAKAGYVSHVQHEFGSILHFTESTFNLGSLGYTDARADDLSDCFNFAQSPRPFVTIQSQLRAADFLHMKPDSRPPDND